MLTGTNDALERGVHRFHVLVAVVQVLRDGLLTFEAGVEQQLGHTVGSAVDLGPRSVVVAVNQARRVGQLVSRHFPDVGKVPVPHGLRSYHPPATPDEPELRL